LACKRAQKSESGIYCTYRRVNRQSKLSQERRSDLMTWGLCTTPDSLCRHGSDRLPADSRSCPAAGIALANDLSKHIRRENEDARLRDVHWPLAQARPDPQARPFGANTSAGHAAEEPVHVSAVSQRASRAARHTCVSGANWHCEVQQALLPGSHTAPERNLQIV